MRDSLEEEWAAHVDAAIAAEKREREYALHKQVAVATYATFVHGARPEIWPTLAKDAIRCADVFIQAYKSRI